MQKKVYFAYYAVKIRKILKLKLFSMPLFEGRAMKML